MNFISRTHTNERSKPHSSSTPQVWKRDPAISEKPRDGQAKSRHFPTLAKLVSATSLVFALCRQTGKGLIQSAAIGTLSIVLCTFTSDSLSTARSELLHAEARFSKYAYSFSKRDAVAPLVSHLELEMLHQREIFTDPEPREQEIIDNAFALLERVPCSLPGFTNWKQYVFGKINSIWLFSPPFMARFSIGSVALDDPERLGDYILFRNVDGPGVVILDPDAAAHIPATMVHEATHLYPLPIPFNSPDISINQALELTASAIELRFVMDYEAYLRQLPESEKQHMPDLSDIWEIKFSDHVPRIMDNEYGPSKFKDVRISRFLSPEGR